MNDHAVAASTGSCSTPAPGFAQCLAEGGALAQLPVQVNHQARGGLVVDRHHAGDDPGRAERDQRAGQAEQLVSAGRGEHAGVAAGQDQPVRRAVQPLEVVDGERAVVHPQRGEQRAVGAERPVRRDVGERRAVERVASTRRGGGRPRGQHGGAGILGSECLQLAAAGARPGPRISTGPARSGGGTAARACSQARADGATLTSRSRSAGSSAQGTACSVPGGIMITGPSPRRPG